MNETHADIVSAVKAMPFADVLAEMGRRDVRVTSLQNLLPGMTREQVADEYERACRSYLVLAMETPAEPPTVSTTQPLDPNLPQVFAGWPYFSGQH